MKRWIWFTGVILSVAVLSGCGGGGNDGPPKTGAIEGYVYVSQDDKTAISVSRTAEPPLGYVALFGADIKVEIGGKTYTTKTDANGHFKVENLPSGMAKVTVTPPLLGGTTLGEFFAYTTTMEVKANTTAMIGSNGNISLISSSADHLEVLVNQIDTSDFPTVRLFVSVIDPIRSSPVIGITKDNFQVSVSQTPIGISAFRQVATNSNPASVSLVLDRSGSMDGQPLEDLKSAAREFVGYMGIDDRAEVISFESEITVDCPFTFDKIAIKSAIDQIQSGNMTALYDAIYKGIEDTISDSNQRKAVVAMTDGGENASYSATLESVISLAKQAGIPIYTIGLQGAGFTREQSTKTISRERSEQELQQIATQTGGEYFYAPQSSDLMGIYTKITQRQQQQYVLTITDPNPQSTSVRSVEVKVNACSLSGSGSTSYQNRGEIRWPVKFLPQVPPGNWSDTMNCGPASLVMAVSYVQNIQPTSQMILDIDDYLGLNENGSSGTSCQQLIDASQSLYYLTLSKNYWDINRIKTELQVGGIVIAAVKASYLSNRGYNYSGSHFVVVIGYKPDCIICNDPGTSQGEGKEYKNSEFQQAIEDQNGAVVTGFRKTIF